MIRMSSVLVISFFLSFQIHADLRLDVPKEILADLGIFDTFVETKSICDDSDSRTPSFELPIGRILQTGAPAGCTVTMIGRTCAISAGHCLRTFEEVHFNTPLSSNGQIQLPDEEDIYFVDKDSIVHEYRGIGADWAVLRIQQNELTGQWPGDVQGYLPTSFAPRRVGDYIRITGYGRAAGPDVNFAQQTHIGPIVTLDPQRHILRHRADTTGGNSGSAVVDERTGEIIGVHTHAGCTSRGGANHSTLAEAHQDLQEAVYACLAWEREHL